MTALKFRVWLKEARQMRYDVTGFEHGDDNTMTIVFVDGDPYRIGSECDVMQCIGSAYKLVPEIYENDILVAKNVFEDGDEYMGVVTFDEHTFKLARLVQSKEAKNRGYTDFVCLWNDGTNDHYSIELLRQGTENISLRGTIYGSDIEDVEIPNFCPGKKENIKLSMA